MIALAAASPAHADATATANTNADGVTDAQVVTPFTGGEVCSPVCGGGLVGVQDGAFAKAVVLPGSIGAGVIVGASDGNGHAGSAGASFVDFLHVSFATPTTETLTVDDNFSVHGLQDTTSGGFSHAVVSFSLSDGSDIEVAGGCTNEGGGSDPIACSSLGNIVGNYSVSLNIPIGTVTFDYMLSMGVHTLADAFSGGVGDFESAQADYFNTAMFIGDALLDPTGNVVTDYTLTSDSGFDYKGAGAGAVPEPSSLALLAGGVLGVFFRARRPRPRR